MTGSVPKTEGTASTDTEAVAADAAAAVPVWDLPIRLFHWSLVALIGFSWWSAENDLIEWHIWSGLGVMTLLIFRLLWGIFGSSTARFGRFVRGPRAVAAYLRKPGEWRELGHTPVGALSVVALLGLLALQVWFGLPLSDDDGVYAGPLNPFVSFETAEWAHEMHELLFNILLGFIALHVAAILFYRVVLGKRLVGAMITGRSTGAAATQPMQRGKWWVALLCLVAAIATTRWVIAGAPPFGT